MEEGCSRAKEMGVGERRSCLYSPEGEKTCRAGNTGDGVVSGIVSYLEREKRGRTLHDGGQFYVVTTVRSALGVRVWARGFGFQM